MTFNLRFPGQYYDAGTGHFYNHNRYYNPELGRYMEPDPIGLEGGLNPYAYAGNNPVMNVDPSGLMVPLALQDMGNAYVNNGHLNQAINNFDRTLKSNWLFNDDWVSSTKGGAVTPVYPEFWLAGGGGVVKGIYSTGKSVLSINSPSSLSFSQVTASPYFSLEGSFSGQSINSVASQLRSGVLSPNKVPVQTVNLGSGNLIVNTRSSLALMQSGTPQSKWSMIDMTSNPVIMSQISQRLLKNGLSNAGTDTIRITGAGKSASVLKPR